MNRREYSEVTIKSVLDSMGENISFIELGVLRASTLIYVAEECENVTSVVGVDSYKPYIDALEPDYCYSVNESLSIMNKSVAERKILNSKKREKIKLVLLDSAEAAKTFADGSIDCIFLDAYMNEKDVCDHVTSWLPKIKNGGVLLGHDAHTTAVKNGLKKLNINFVELEHNIWMHKT